MRLHCSCVDPENCTVPLDGCMKGSFVSQKEHDTLRQQVAELEAALKNERAQHIEATRLHAEFMNEVHKPLEAQVAAYREALEFYADEGNWHKDDWGVLAVIDPPDYNDCGITARTALEKGDV